MKQSKIITASAPGRICLFGEHQDYLGLPVITSAIDLRITITGIKRTDILFYIKMPDILKSATINPRKPIVYTKQRDYLKSVFNVLIRAGVKLDRGYDCIIKSAIPINSGTSSSSAMITAWTAFLLTAMDDPRRNNPLEIAKFAHSAEVLEFNEPGGMMDHYSCSFGNVMYIDFSKDGSYETLNVNPGVFVLGNSLESKNTRGLLKWVKSGILKALEVLQSKDPSITISTLNQQHLDEHKELLSQGQLELLTASMENREITQQAKKLFQEPFDKILFGRLLNEHQNRLRDLLRISTPKIDCMISAALDAGALGAKINGSGGGGCMFAYAPENYEQVAEAINKAGGKAYIINPGKGVEVVKG